jgi:hypothetical protein
MAIRRPKRGPSAPEDAQKSSSVDTFVDKAAKFWIGCRRDEQRRTALVRLMVRIFTSDFTSRNLCR